MNPITPRGSGDAENRSQEYTINNYVIWCFTVTALVFTLVFVLNLVNIFVVDQKLMMYAYIPSLIIYLIVFVVTRFVSLDNPKVKYFLLLSVAAVITIMGVFITYHVIMVPILLFLFATLYSSKTVMWYSFILNAISTLVTVYCGYYYGLCDANMVLLTQGALYNYVQDGVFTLTAVNTNPAMTLFLYFVVPRCLAYLAFSSVFSSIFTILKRTTEKAKRTAELENFQIELENKVREQTEEIRRQQKKMEDLYTQTITALSEAVDAKDRYTSGHSRRVAEYSYMIAERMGKSLEEREEIYRAGLLHDMGKLRIPAEIINKPGKLTDEEYNIIKIHPATGYHILRGISEDRFIAIAARYHHERFDGKGYPNGIAGENIPEIARIIGVADAYDAMTSNRSYRNALPQDVVRSEIERCKGTQFDAAVADVMLQMIDEDKDYVLKQAAMAQRRVLTIDPDVEDNEALADIMSDEPMYEMVSATTGGDALDLIEAESVDLIIIDVKIIEKEGMEVLDAIKAAAGVPIVVMTSNNAEDIAKVMAVYGCDDHITKPFLPILIKEIVYNLTERTIRAGY